MPGSSTSATIRWPICGRPRGAGCRPSTTRSSTEPPRRGSRAEGLTPARLDSAAAARPRRRRLRPHRAAGPRAAPDRGGGGAGGAAPVLGGRRDRLRPVAGRVRRVGGRAGPGLRRRPHLTACCARATSSPTWSATTRPRPASRSRRCGRPARSARWPACTRAPPSELKAFLTRRRAPTVGQLAEQLGVSLSEVPALADLVDLRLDIPGRGRHGAVGHRRPSRRSAARSSCGPPGCGSGCCATSTTSCPTRGIALVVDLGWGGTIQTLLSPGPALVRARPAPDRAVPGDERAPRCSAGSTASRWRATWPAPGSRRGRSRR